MKRLLIFVCLLTSVQLTAQVTLTVPTVHGSPGEKVLIPILIDQAADLCALRFDLDLGGDIHFLEDSSYVFAGSVFSDHGIATSLKSSSLRVLITSPSLSEFKQESGVVAQVLVEVAQSANPGVIQTIGITNPSASDVDGNTLSVSANSGNLVVSNQQDVPSLGQNQLVFPQVANGGGYRTTVLVVNTLDSESQVKLSFSESGNQPLNIKLEDGTTNSTFSFLVPAKGSRVIRSDGSGPLKVGFAVMESTSPLTGTILFEVRSGAGVTLTEAGVMSSPQVLQFEIPVLYKPGQYDTGLAFLNLNSESVDLEMVAKMADGSIYQTKTEILSAFQHLPLFSTQLFNQLNQLGEFEGSIEVTASLPVTAVALKLTGQVLTTFPISTSN